MSVLVLGALCILFKVDPEIFLKRHKFPKDELMMNPYLRFPIYHRQDNYNYIQVDTRFLSFFSQ